MKSGEILDKFVVSSKNLVLDPFEITPWLEMAAPCDILPNKFKYFSLSGPSNTTQFSHLYFRHFGIIPWLLSFPDIS